ncbi:hypothetical protein [Flagellimonas algicola]|uniref:Uncharacterized protein n=1 Tax=Flagellimonas algicola TaxID=2583815 RepID=A0ABY2WGJ6_9FLAO|nr:hypothetical protein [Allomuricauda algicola]TMU50419.1 hypothetical protein FGG15_19545 [Allomuricauda algicola]
MKYTDAVSNKSQFPNQIDYDGMKMKVVTALKLEDDFIRFVEDFPVMNYNDKCAIPYSTNQQFRVCALWTDGASVMHKGKLSELLGSSEEE